MSTIFSIAFIGLFPILILLIVFNVVIRKKKINHTYTPFDDVMKGIKK